MTHENTYFEVSPPLFMTVNKESKDVHPKVTFKNGRIQKSHFAREDFPANEPFPFGLSEILER